jgi:hypothetical protein
MFSSFGKINIYPSNKSILVESTNKYIKKLIEKNENKQIENNFDLEDNKGGKNLNLIQIPSNNSNFVPFWIFLSVSSFLFLYSNRNNKFSFYKYINI